MDSKPSSKLQILMLLLLGVVIMGSLLATNLEAKSFSAIENKQLPEFPTRDALVSDFYQNVEDAQSADMFDKFSFATSWLAKAFDGYCSNRIGFRAEYLALCSGLQDGLFHYMNHPSYEYGTDGYSFFRYASSNMNADYLEDYALWVRRMQDYCEQRGIPFLFVITPEKKNVYPEYLPDSIGEMEDWSEMLEPYLDQLDVDYLNLTNTLIATKEEGVQVFNKVYDAGHWNTEGMYYGSQAIIEALQDKGIDVEDIDLDDYRAEYTEQTTLPNSSYPIKETTYRFEHIENGKRAVVVDDSSKNGLELSSQYSFYCQYQNRAIPSTDTLLMLQGSYFNTQGTMLQHQFSHAVQVHDYDNALNLPYYLDVFQPSVVVFETASYTIQNSYYPHERIRVACLSEPCDTALIQEAHAEPSLSSYYLFFDEGAGIATFHIKATALFGWIPQSAYIITEDGRVFDTAIDIDTGDMLWGCKTEVIEEEETATIVALDEDGNAWSAEAKFIGY